MISITPEAVNKAKKLQEHSDTGLRVKVQGGGCSGLEYVLSFDYYNDKDFVGTISMVSGGKSNKNGSCIINEFVKTWLFRRGILTFFVILLLKIQMQIQLVGVVKVLVYE